MTTAPMPSEMPIRDFLEAIASGEGIHGAVSAATVAGGIGTSILRMVAVMPKRTSIAPHDWATLVNAATGLTELQQQLFEAIETETAVKIFAARNMPQSSEAQRTERHAALQLALRAAADVPLEIMRLCGCGLKYAETIARCSARAASGDVQMAITLLQAGFNGARANLEAKLGSLADAAYVTSVVDQIARLSEEAEMTARVAGSHVQPPTA
jgi:formiminotetrahydrofolate cyclodeaminase